MTAADGLVYQIPPRQRPTLVVGTFRESQEQTNLRPKTQKIKLYPGARKALKIPWP